MHRKSVIRWPRFVILALLLALILGGVAANVVFAIQPAPDATCSGGQCTLKFSYSGEPYLWTPPAGVDQLQFELFGAQGGQGARSTSAGGLAGRVAGTFTSIPANLYIFVGGAGSRGSGAAGGFNGGGDAGVGHGDEGSGGGASDLRTSQSLLDRAVVAGGGGGAGGYDWGEAGLGGAGGRSLAAAGSAGQAGPGYGGGQLAGGQAGRINGGTIGTDGVFGVGGKGGSSRFAGGGGGGGGYYGGGGGGSDIDSAGLNGGGGGGGSSYADPSLTASVVNDSGVGVGNGLVVLSFRLVTVASATPTPTDTPIPTETPTPTTTPTSTESPTPAESPAPSTPVTPEPAQLESSPSPTAFPMPAIAPEESPTPAAVVYLSADPPAPGPQPESSIVPPTSAENSADSPPESSADSPPASPMTDLDHFWSDVVAWLSPVANPSDGLPATLPVSRNASNAGTAKNTGLAEDPRLPEHPEVQPETRVLEFRFPDWVTMWTILLSVGFVTDRTIRRLWRLKQNRQAFARRLVRIN